MNRTCRVVIFVLFFSRGFFSFFPTPALGFEILQVPFEADEVVSEAKKAHTKPYCAVGQMKFELPLLEPSLALDRIRTLVVNVRLYEHYTTVYSSTYPALPHHDRIGVRRRLQRSSPTRNGQVATARTAVSTRQGGIHYAACLLAVRVAVGLPETGSSNHVGPNSVRRAGSGLLGRDDLPQLGRLGRRFVDDPCECSVSLAGRSRPRHSTTLECQADFCLLRLAGNSLAKNGERRNDERTPPARSWHSFWLDGDVWNALRTRKKVSLERGLVSQPGEMSRFSRLSPWRSRRSAINH